MSLSFADRAGRARSPGAARLTPRSPVTIATTASTTRANVAAARVIKPRFCISRARGLGGRSRFRGAAASPLQAQDTEDNSDTRDENRDQRNIEKFESGLQSPDISAQ